MSLFATLRCWWRAIINRSHIDYDVKEEFQFYIDSYAEDLIRQGMEPDEAQRQARITLGRAEMQNEKYRDAIGLRAFDELGADIRYGLRSLFKNPGYATVAVLSLALGIGATTAMFSMIYAVLIHPFPYADSDRIMNPVLIDEQNPQQYRWFAMYKPQFELFSHARSIESLLGFRNVNMEITGNELPEDVAAIYLTENADTFFGVRALLGRGIQPSDAQSSGQPIVVLNYKFWQRHFNGDPAVIGGTLQLDHASYTIVGVMPRSFAFSDMMGVGDVYLPRSLLHDTVNPPIRWPYTPWIKLKPNVSRVQADAELLPLVKQFAKENPHPYPKQFHLQLQPIIGPFEENSGHTLHLLLAAVLLLLAIGCANCSILLLARGEARQHELAVRSAIGASRWRIIRQLLVESLVVAFSGAVLGVVASYWLAQLPLKLSPDSFPAESVIRINLPVLAFSVGLALCSGILFGLVPALKLSRPDPARTMQASLRRISGSSNRRRWNLLIAGQIALTLLLLATAGSAIGGFLRLMKTPLGYDPNNVMQAGIVLHWNNPRDWESIKSREDRAAFIDRVRQKISAVPGVTSVAISTGSSIPPYSGFEQPIEFSGKGTSEECKARVHVVGPEFFATLKIPLLRGRIWDQTENQRGDFIAIVNESFVNHYWPQEDPIGKKLRIPSFKSGGPLEVSSPHSDDSRQVIGVIGDLRNDGLDRPVAPAIYLPYTSYMPPFAQFVIRTQGEPLAYLHAVREAVRSVASDQQISNGAYDLSEAIERDAQWTRQKLFSVLFGVFSTLALLLALAGLFSVVSWSVAQKTSEFGVRMALGASRSHILWVAMRVAARSVIIGISVGLTIELFIHKLLIQWMNNSDLASNGLAVATLLLVISALIACLLPARRAISIHPVEALRYE
jgi:predicted permease